MEAHIWHRKGETYTCTSLTHTHINKILNELKINDSHRFRCCLPFAFVSCRVVSCVWNAFIWWLKYCYVVDICVKSGNLSLDFNFTEYVAKWRSQWEMLLTACDNNLLLSPHCFPLPFQIDEDVSQSIRKQAIVLNKYTFYWQSGVWLSIAAEKEIKSTCINGNWVQSYFNWTCMRRYIWYYVPFYCTMFHFLFFLSCCFFMCVQIHFCTMTCRLVTHRINVDVSFGILPRLCHWASSQIFFLAPESGRRKG